MRNFSPLQLSLKRVYASPSPEDGVRVLVDRLWPRGLSKSKAAIDRWVADLAPSSDLRRWFHHDPELWEEFRRKYELELSQRGDLLEELRATAKRTRVTLLYGSRDGAHNHAVVLRDMLMR
ncbi:MAG: DUF488 family protein [Methylocystis sp.]